MTQHKCTGISDISRVCVFDNLVLFNGTLYYVTDEDKVADIYLQSIDIAIIPKFEGDGVIQGQEINVVNYNQSPFNRPSLNKTQVEYGIFLHRYANVTYQKMLLTHSPIIHYHMCQKFEVCSYEDGQNVQIVFWDNIKSQLDVWPKAAQQLYRCFSDKQVLQRSICMHDQENAYIFGKAVIGIGSSCLDFKGCNKAVMGTARRNIMYGAQLLSWKQKIQDCAQHQKKEFYKQDTSHFFKLKYTGPKDIKSGSSNEDYRHFRFIDRTDHPSRLQNIDQMKSQIIQKYGSHQRVEIISVSEKSANLWERTELFAEADIVVSPFWEMLNGVIFMKNCTCLVVMYPGGMKPILYNDQVDVLLYGHVGLPSYLGMALRLYIYVWQDSDNEFTEVDWNSLESNVPKFNQRPEDKIQTIKKQLDCDRKFWSRECQLEWINNYSAIKLDWKFFGTAINFAMKTTELCYTNTYPPNLAADMWPYSQCTAGDFRSLLTWIVGSKQVGKSIPPGPNFPFSLEHCNVVYGWIHGTEITRMGAVTPKECCEKCMQEAECSAWNYCQCQNNCGEFGRLTCILKKLSPSPYHTYIQGDIYQYNRWIGGFPNVTNYESIRTCSPIKANTFENQTTQGWSLSCPNEQCNAHPGNFTNSKLLDDLILKIIPSQNDDDQNPTPSRCCQHCQDEKRCNIWTFCNSPEGCPCDDSTNGLNGCVNGMVQPFVCMLKYSKNVENGKQPEYFEVGYFTSLVSGYLVQEQ